MDNTCKNRDVTILLYSTETFTAEIHSGSNAQTLESVSHSVIEPGNGQGQITILGTITLTEPTAIEVTTSSPAYMIVRQGASDSGSTALLDQTGSVSGNLSSSHRVIMNY